MEVHFDLHHMVGWTWFYYTSTNIYLLDICVVEESKQWKSILICTTWLVGCGSTTLALTSTSSTYVLLKNQIKTMEVHFDLHHMVGWTWFYYTSTNIYLLDIYVVEESKQWKSILICTTWLVGRGSTTLALTSTSSTYMLLKNQNNGSPF